MSWPAALAADGADTHRAREMSWNVVPNSGEPFSSDEPTDALALVWRVENAVGDNVPIEVSVSDRAHRTPLADYLGEIQEAVASEGESEVLRAIADLPDTTTPPRWVRLSFDGRQSRS